MHCTCEHCQTLSAEIQQLKELLDRLIEDIDSVICLLKENGSESFVDDESDEEWVPSDTDE